VLIAGLALGGLVIQTWRLDQSKSEKSRLTRVSNTLAEKVSKTQRQFAEIARSLDPTAEPAGPERAYARVFDQKGRPLDEELLELAFRDLDMREELKSVRKKLNGLSTPNTKATVALAAHRAEVKRLEESIAALKQERMAFHGRLEHRLKDSVNAYEAALSATGVDYRSLMDASRGPSPFIDGQSPGGQAVGGPFIADDTQDYVNPIAGDAEVMSGFGPRGREHHNGIDVLAPVGTAVLAVTSGEIIHVQDRQKWQNRSKWMERGDSKVKSPGWRAGIYLEVKHDDGRVSRYMHLGALAPEVKLGARILKGQVLGSVGRTGVEMSETHLHFELREAGEKGERYGSALDPTVRPVMGDFRSKVGMSLLRADPKAAEFPTSEDAKAAAAAASKAQVEKGVNGLMDHVQGLEELLSELPLVPPIDNFRVSSGFGRRRDPLNGEWTHHDGVDMPAPPKTTIRAPAPGKVIFAGERGRYGIMVELDHGNGVITRYGHLYRSLVRKGEYVKYRARIGQVGSSGRSTAPHLHYEIRVDDKPRDPMNFIQAGRYVFKR